MAQAIRTTSKTLEGQLFEILQALLALQDNALSNPDGFKLIESSFSANNLSFSGSFNFPFEQRMDSMGNLVFSVKSCLHNLPTESTI